MQLTLLFTIEFWQYDTGMTFKKSKLANNAYTTLHASQYLNTCTEYNELQ